MFEVSFEGKGSGEYVVWLNDEYFLDPDFNFDNFSVYGGWYVFENWNQTTKSGNNYITPTKTWTGNGGWDVNYITDANYLTNGESTKNISTPFAFSNLNDYDLNISGRVFSTQNSTQSYWCFFCQTTAGNGDGYKIFTDDSQHLKIIGTVDWNQIEIVENNWYDINISRSTSGFWRFWINGTGLPANYYLSFQDTNFTTSNYMSFYHTTATPNISTATGQFGSVKLYAPSNFLQISIPTDADNSSPISPYSITVKYPNGSTSDFNSLTSNKVLYNLTQSGTYTVFVDNVSGDDYYSQTFTIDLNIVGGNVINPSLVVKPLLKILIPVDETNKDLNIVPFAVSITNPLGVLTDYNLQTDILRIYNVVSGTYVITVDDTNGNAYYSRNYVYSSTGLGKEEIQPILAKITESTSFSVFILDAMNLLPLWTPTTNLKIELWGDVNGLIGKQLIESKNLSSTGTGIFSGIDLKTYEIKIYKNNVLIDTRSIEITATSFYLGILSSAVDSSNQVPYFYQIRVNKNVFQQKDDNVVVDVGQSRSRANKLNVKVKLVDSVNGTLWSYDSNHDVNAVPQSWMFFTYSDFNVNNNDTNSLVIYFTLYDVNGRIGGSVEVFILKSAGKPLQNWVHGLMYGLRQDFSCSTDNIFVVPCFPLFFLATFIVFMIAIGFGLVASFDEQNLELVVLGLFGVFSFLGWIPAIVFGLLVVVVFFLNFDKVINFG